jgi:tetratricopeptide (TPR) repeat protein
MRGSYPEARAAYEEVLREAPEYAPALAARGRLHLASDRVAEALVDLDAALRVQPLTSTRAAYVEALWAAGQSDAAKAELERLVREGRREDPRTLALFYSTHDLERAEALALATAEAKIRPDIFSLDALAWALYRNGKLDEAWVAIQQATRLGTRDPRLLYHRGRIAASRNMKQEAIEKLTLALKSSRWNRKESEDARTTLAQLQGR